MKLNTLRFVFVLLLLASCRSIDKTETGMRHTKEGLHQYFNEDFFIGTAINANHIRGLDSIGVQLIEKEFNSLSPENVMKWMFIHPEPNVYSFDNADKYVNIGKRNKMHVVGHTLVWHSQLADWVNEIRDSTQMANMLITHIDTLVRRYKGDIESWDVVNEALNEDGSLRKSQFYNVMGEDYIALAFQKASEADSEAQLVYNDYNLWKPEKRAGVVRLVKKLQQQGIKIDAVGMQAHWSVLGPTIEDIENSILAFSELGVKVLFTELDVTALPNPWELNGAAVEQDYSRYENDPKMNPFPQGMNDSIDKQLSLRYQQIFKLFLKHSDKIGRVTFWGLQDGQSWLNNWPIKGRTNYPLLFDRQYQRKSAYDSVVALKH